MRREAEGILKRALSIAVPASLVLDIPHLREKTQRIGMVGRAAAIFGVREILVFPDCPDRDQRVETRLISTILSYLETPQYLRKRLFKLMPELKCAGVLPPLRTPHHPLRNRVRDLADGEYRDGVVVAQTNEGASVDVGVERPALIRGETPPINARVTVQLGKGQDVLNGRLIDRGGIESYWGYRVTSSDVPLGSLLQRRSFDLVVATSRYGRPLLEVAGDLLDRWRTAQHILVVFGAPTRGVYDIVKQEGLALTELVDFVVNVFPRQEVETVRTEEAVYVSLGALSLMAAKG
jgi:predicted SPOUT superfamily RNA methylase MTH1